MQSISVFLDIAGFGDFRWADAGVGGDQRACRVIHMFFGSSLGRVLLCQVSLLWDMGDNFRKRGPSAIFEQPWKCPS